MLRFETRLSYQLSARLYTTGSETSAKDYQSKRPELGVYFRMPGVDGEFVLGLLASVAAFCRDASENILFARLRRPRNAGVSALASRF